MASLLHVMTRKEKVVLPLAAGLAVAAGLAHGRTSETVAFLVAAAALSMLAMVVGAATEHIGSKLSPGATGVLHSALGNLPEMMVCVFSLRAGLVEVVKGALIGSILANSVLLLGFALLLGGWKNGTMKFRSDPPRMMAVLMLLACAALAVPTLAHNLHTPAELHEKELSLVCAVVLILVYISSVPFFLKGDPEVTPEPDHEPHPVWPTWFSIVVLLFSAVGAALVSEWFVEALKPATAAMGLSEAFTGLVVVAIAGNAVEHLVGVQLAIKNKMDLSLSVILNSSLQVALLVVPVLVMVSFFVGPAPMTLVLAPMLLAAMLFAAIVPAFVVFDGEAIWLEGVALIGLYALVAAAFWWG